MRKWLLIGGALAAVLALVGILGGTLLAQRYSTTTEKTFLLTTHPMELLAQRYSSTTEDDVYARAAAKLGVDAQALEDALTEAWEEVKAERKTEAEQRLRDHLDELVEDGKLTRKEADEWLDWLLGRSDADGDLGKKRWGGGRFDKIDECKVEIGTDDRAFRFFCGRGGWTHPPFDAKPGLDWPPGHGERFGKGAWEKRYFFYYGDKS